MSVVKSIISGYNRFCSLFDSAAVRLKSLRQVIYSDRYCKKFGCRDCSFMRPLGYVVGPQYFHMGERNIFGKFSALTAWGVYNDEHHTPEVFIGDDCNFGEFLHLTCINKIAIGSGVLTGRWVTITDNSHGVTDEMDGGIPPHQRQLYSKGPVVIEDNVWIGDKATILPGVTVGKNSIIGANSVVTKSVPANSVVVGNPAKIVSINTAYLGNQKQ